MREFYEELTIGAGPRMSLLGGRSASASFPPSDTSSGGGGYATGPVPGGARSGQTQVGEPLFPTGVPGTPGSVGAPHTPAHTMVDQAPMGPSPGGVPTGGGQAFPAPPPAQPSKGGAGPIIGGVAVLVVGAIIAAVVLLRPKPADPDPKPNRAPELGERRGPASRRAALRKPVRHSERRQHRQAHERRQHERGERGGDLGRLVHRPGRRRRLRRGDEPGARKQPGDRGRQLPPVQGTEASQGARRAQRRIGAGRDQHQVPRQGRPQAGGRRRRLRRALAVQVRLREFELGVRVASPAPKPPEFGGPT